MSLPVQQRLLFLLLLTWGMTLHSSFALAASSSRRSVLVTGGNRGQGYALCRRILTERDDTHVFLCARRDDGRTAVNHLLRETDVEEDRVTPVSLDVTDPASVRDAVTSVRERLARENDDDDDDGRLHGVVSNAGVLWGYPLEQQFDVNTVGACRVLDHFLPLLRRDGGRLIVVSSGLGPLMHGYARADRQAALRDPDLTTDDLMAMMKDCLHDESAEGLAAAGFPGGPFAESVPDFHKYGLAKMMTDAYMLRLSRDPDLSSMRIASCDPGLVYTDLIRSMPRYEGLSQDETGAKSPAEGVEAAMRLLFDDDDLPSGRFYTMNRARTKLLHSTIDAQPKE